MSRLQLRAKGDSGIWANIVSVVFACGGAFIPLTFYLTDRKGASPTCVTCPGTPDRPLRATPLLVSPQ